MNTGSHNANGGMQCALYVAVLAVLGMFVSACSFPFYLVIDNATEEDVMIVARYTDGSEKQCATSSGGGCTIVANRLDQVSVVRGRRIAEYRLPALGAKYVNHGPCSSSVRVRMLANGLVYAILPSDDLKASMLDQPDGFPVKPGRVVDK